jgi:hypothetical protein
MRRITLAVLSLALWATGPAGAGTFNSTAIAPEYGVNALTRGVARTQLGKSVFSNPYATVTLGTVDVYDVFPYVEARRFQIVSDPAWNRLVGGEVGKGLGAYDGKSSPFGPLSEPRGLAVDDRNRIYIADSGNDRIVVLQAVTEFDVLSFRPLYEIRGLNQPYGVAVSDGGTPFDAADDRLYVADTGKNRVASFALEDNGARLVATIGDLGSGDQHFGGPMAIAVGRSSGVHTKDVYVADAHNQRIVRLRDDGASLVWVGEQKHDADIVTALDTDQWGNVYAAAPNKSAVFKFNPDLSPVATLKLDGERPRSFHVPFLNVNDHRTGKIERTGQAKGLLVESWTDQTGIKLWDLGLEVADLAVVGGDAPAARFMLTDRAAVTYEVRDAANNKVIARSSGGTLAAGLHTIPLEAAAFATTAGGPGRILRVSAVSSYGNGPSDVTEAGFRIDGAGQVLPPNAIALLDNVPNPVRFSTRIAFLLPADTHGPVSLRLLDARGRLVRRITGNFAPGLNEVNWDGRDERGVRVTPGVYFSRLEVGTQVRTGRMVVIGS